jgi:hypothetical protein
VVEANVMYRSLCVAVLAAVLHSSLGRVSGKNEELYCVISVTHLSRSVLKKMMVVVVMMIADYDDRQEIKYL